MLNEIYEEKKSKCQMVSIEVRKTQHKYIIGQQANNLYEILDKVRDRSSVGHYLRFVHMGVL